MIKNLSLQNLENIKNFKYAGTDNSLFYSKILSPCLNKLINYFPQSLAPNLITLMSFFFNILSFYITLMDGGLDYYSILSRGTCLFQAVAHILYYVLDNLDGKQARRTGTSTAYGMLLDHGCDVFTNIIVAFNMSHLLILGSNNFISFLFFSGLFLGFFSLTYQEYIFGELLLPEINGANEGNLLIVIFSLVGFFFGCGIYRNKFLFFRLGQWITIAMFIMAIWTTGIQAFIKIIKQKGFGVLKNVLIDWIDIFLCILVPFLLSVFNNDMYSFFYDLMVLQMCLMYARITLEVQMSIIIKEKLKYSIGLYFSILVLFTIFITNYRAYIAIYAYSSLILGTEIILFVIIRSMEILYYLKIKLLCINSPIPISNTSIQA